MKKIILLSICIASTAFAGFPKQFQDFINTNPSPDAVAKKIDAYPPAVPANIFSAMQKLIDTAPENKTAEYQAILDQALKAAKPRGTEAALIRFRKDQAQAQQDAAARDAAAQATRDAAAAQAAAAQTAQAAAARQAQQEAAAQATAAAQAQALAQKNAEIARLNTAAQAAAAQAQAARDAAAQTAQAQAARQAQQEAAAQATAAAQAQALAQKDAEIARLNTAAQAAAAAQAATLQAQQEAANAYAQTLLKKDAEIAQLKKQVTDSEARWLQLKQIHDAQVKNTKTLTADIRLAQKQHNKEEHADSSESDE